MKGMIVPVSVVDINCDMGEAYGQWRLSDTDDAELMGLICSANIAAGFHAGDPNLMNTTVRLASEAGVGIGVHPGYRDLQGFGRRKIGGGTDEIINDIVYQIGAMREFTRLHGATLQHVKPHGALYMELAISEALSRSFIKALRTIAPEAFVFCMAASETYRAAIEAGQPAIREFYADREYDRLGSIVFTRHAARLDAKQIAEKVLRACRENRVCAIDGVDIEMEFDSICFHSDTPGCLDMVRSTRQILIENGIRIASVSEIFQDHARHPGGETRQVAK